MDKQQEHEIVAQVPPFFYYYQDGSVRRNPPGPLQAPSAEPGQDGVASKDITLDAGLGLWARIFLPSTDQVSSQKLPIVLYFHGGGFLFGGPAWNHSFCTDIAKRSRSIWVSASYRLAPEHRLPAAFEDGFAALRWIHTQALLQEEHKEGLMDGWLAAKADFSKTFLAGESAGGSLAHHVAMQALNKPMSSGSWGPLCIAGLILIHPGFVRENRTREEIECAQDVMMNWDLADTCIELARPLEDNKDKALLNPLSGFAAIGGKFVLPRTLVALADRDALHFMGLEYIQALKDSGCLVDMVMSQGVGHVFFTLQPESEQAVTLMEKIASFITEEL